MTQMLSSNGSRNSRTMCEAVSSSSIWMSLRRATPQSHSSTEISTILPTKQQAHFQFDARMWIFPVAQAGFQTTIGRGMLAANEIRRPTCRLPVGQVRRQQSGCSPTFLTRAVFGSIVLRVCSGWVQNSTLRSFGPQTAPSVLACEQDVGPPER